MLSVSVLCFKFHSHTQKQAILFWIWFPLYDCFKGGLYEVPLWTSGLFSLLIPCSIFMSIGYFLNLAALDGTFSAREDRHRQHEPCFDECSKLIAQSKQDTLQCCRILGGNLRIRTIFRNYVWISPLSPYMSYVSPTSSSFVVLPSYLSRPTNYTAFHYVVSSMLMLLPLSIGPNILLSSLRRQYYRTRNCFDLTIWY